MKLRNIVLTLAILGGCSLSMAQWQWIDKDGRKVFSDRGPPPEVPEKNILRRPGARPVVPEAAETTANTLDASPPAAGASATVAKPVGDKELESRKKALADAEKSRNKAEGDRLAKVKAENCTRARQAKATLESGARIGRVNASGEREIMDDAARNAESQRLQGIIAADCSSSSIQ